METPIKPQIIATTEKHHIIFLDGFVHVQHAQSQLILHRQKATHQGLLEAIHIVMDTEVNIPKADECALSLTSAAHDMEAHRKEKRDAILESLCAQCELFIGRTPFPQNA